MENLLSRIIIFFIGTSFVNAQTKVTEPIVVKLINGLPHIEVLINNKGPFLFGLDSSFGAEMELDIDLANELEIKKSGQTAIGDGSSNNLVTLDLGTINSVKIGNEIKNNISAILRNSEMRKRQGMENVKGIIGMGMFPEHRITIDYPRLTFLTEKGNLPIANNKDIFDYEEVGGGISKINIKVGNTNIKAVIDSRSMSGEFKIPEEIAKKLTFLTTPKLVGKGRTISSTIDINEVQIKESIELGQFIFNEPTITYPSLNQDAIIGAKLLQKFIITIDTKNKRLQLVKGIESKKNKDLLEYEGQFGDRKLTVEGDFLYIQRPNGVVLKMLPRTKMNLPLK